MNKLLDEQYADILERYASVSTREARAGLANLVNQVRFQHTKIVITIHGKPAAVLVPIEDLEALRQIDQGLTGIDGK